MLIQFLQTQQTFVYHCNQMENIQRTQQSQKNIVNTQQKQQPRLSTRDQQEVDEQNQQKREVLDVVKHKTIQQTQSIIINKHNDLDQNTRYCRICFEGEIPQLKLLSPCSCSNCVHDSCLLDWLRHKQLLNNQNSMKCQVCLSTYSIDIMQKYCFTFKICKRQKQKFIPSFIAQLMIFLVLLSTTGLLIVFLVFLNYSQDFADQAQLLVNLPKNTLIVLGLIGLLFSSALSACLSCKIIHNFCYGVQITLLDQSRQ